MILFHVSVRYPLPTAVSTERCLLRHSGIEPASIWILTPELSASDTDIMKHYKHIDKGKTKGV